jgi:FkbM family methyltransferase
MYKNFLSTVIQSVPIEWRYTAATVKNAFLGKWRHHYYSHFGEDVFVNAHFRQQQKGLYVDVGAHHPRRYSNTALLYERGWSGINIEPNVHIKSSFERLRPKDVHVCCGVGLHETTMQFHVFSDPAVSTFSPENAERLKKKRWLRETAVITVPIKKLVTILDEHMPNGQTIDFLNVDVEDLDYDVLRSNDWDRYAPRVVAIEDRLFNFLAPTQSEIHAFMSGKGYVLVAQLGLTLIYMSHDEYERVLRVRRG